MYDRRHSPVLPGVDLEMNGIKDEEVLVVLTHFSFTFPLLPQGSPVHILFFFFLPFCRLPFSDCSVAYIVSPKVGIQAWNLPDLPVAYSLISSCPNYKLPGRGLLSSSNQRSTLSPITHSRKAPCSTGLTLLGLSETGSQKKKVWNQEKWFLSFISDFSRTIYYIYTGSSNWHK